MLKELSQKDPYNPQITDRSDAESFKYSQNYGQKLLKHQDYQHEFFRHDGVHQNILDMGQFIPPTGYLPQYSIIRRHAQVNASYLATRGFMPPPIMKRRIIEPKLEQRIRDNFQEVQSRRLDLLENEKAILETSLNRAGFSMNRISALPFENDRNKAVIESFEKLDRLQRIIGVADPYSASGLGMLQKHGQSRGNGMKKSGLNRARKRFGQNGDGGGGNGGDDGGDDGGSGPGGLGKGDKVDEILTKRLNTSRSQKDQEEEKEDQNQRDGMTSQRRRFQQTSSIPIDDETSQVFEQFTSSLPFQSLNPLERDILGIVQQDNKYKDPRLFLLTLYRGLWNGRSTTPLGEAYYSFLQLLLKANKGLIPTDGSVLLDHITNLLQPSEEGSLIRYQKMMSGQFFLSAWEVGQDRSGLNQTLLDFNNRYHDMLLDRFLRSFLLDNDGPVDILQPIREQFNQFMAKLTDVRYRQAREQEGLERDQEDGEAPVQEEMDNPMSSMASVPLQTERGAQNIGDDELLQIALDGNQQDISDPVYSLPKTGAKTARPATNPSYNSIADFAKPDPPQSSSRAVMSNTNRVTQSFRGAPQTINTSTTNGGTKKFDDVAQQYQQAATSVRSGIANNSLQSARAMTSYNEVSLSSADTVQGNNFMNQGAATQSVRGSLPVSTRGGITSVRSAVVGSAVGDQETSTVETLINGAHSIAQPPSANSVRMPMTDANDDMIQRALNETNLLVGPDAVKDPKQAWYFNSMLSSIYEKIAGRNTSKKTPGQADPNIPKDATGTSTAQGPATTGNAGPPGSTPHPDTPRPTNDADYDKMIQDAINESKQDAMARANMDTPRPIHYDPMVKPPKDRSKSPHIPLLPLDKIPSGVPPVKPPVQQQQQGRIPQSGMQMNNQGPLKASVRSAYTLPSEESSSVQSVSSRSGNTWRPAGPIPDTNRTGQTGAATARAGDASGRIGLDGQNMQVPLNTTSRTRIIPLEEQKQFPPASSSSSDQTQTEVPSGRTYNFRYDKRAIKDSLPQKQVKGYKGYYMPDYEKATSSQNAAMDPTQVIVDKYKNILDKSTYLDMLKLTTEHTEHVSKISRSKDGIRNYDISMLELHDAMRQYYDGDGLDGRAQAAFYKAYQTYEESMFPTEEQKQLGPVKRIAMSDVFRKFAGLSISDATKFLNQMADSPNRPAYIPVDASSPGDSIMDHASQETGPLVSEFRIKQLFKRAVSYAMRESEDNEEANETIMSMIKGQMPPVKELQDYILFLQTMAKPNTRLINSLLTNELPLLQRVHDAIDNGMHGAIFKLFTPASILIGGEAELMSDAYISSLFSDAINWRRDGKSDVPYTRSQKNPAPLRLKKPLGIPSIPISEQSNKAIDDLYAEMQKEGMDDLKAMRANFDQPRGSQSQNQSQGSKSARTAPVNNDNSYAGYNDMSLPVRSGSNTSRDPSQDQRGRSQQADSAGGSTQRKPSSKRSSTPIAKKTRSQAAKTNEESKKSQPAPAQSQRNQPLNPISDQEDDASNTERKGKGKKKKGKKRIN